MAPIPDNSPPSDVCLLLRAHAEARWLSHEVVPVVRQIELRDELPDDQLGAALAYLEVIWMEACTRAQETDGAFADLNDSTAGGDHSLHDKARRYHAAVRRLRHNLARRVSTLIAGPERPTLRNHAKS